MSTVKKIILLLFYTLPLFAFAEPLSYSLLEPIGDLTGAQTYAGYVVGILKIGIGLAGLLAVVRIVICGMELLASASPSKISETKACIWSALMGVTLAIAGWLILYTINPTLTNLDIRQVTVNAGRPSAAGFYYTYRATNGSTAYAGPITDAAACEAARVADTRRPTGDFCTQVVAPVIAPSAGTIVCAQGQTCVQWSAAAGTCAADRNCLPIAGHVRNTVADSACGGTKPSGAVCCSYTPAVCPTCVPLEVPFKDGGQATANMNNRLKTVRAAWLGAPWRVTEAFPTTVPHCSNDEMVGNSVDLAFISRPSGIDVLAFFVAAGSAGLNPVYEVNNQARKTELENQEPGLRSRNIRVYSWVNGEHFSLY